MTNYLYLAIAIAAEVVATTSLKAVAGFSKPLPLLLVVGGYVLAFSMLVLVMRTLPVAWSTPSGPGSASSWSAWWRCSSTASAWTPPPSSASA